MFLTGSQVLLIIGQVGNHRYESSFMRRQAKIIQCVKKVIGPEERWHMSRKQLMQETRTSPVSINVLGFKRGLHTKEREAPHPTRFLPAHCILRSQSLVQAATFPDTHPTHGWAGYPLPVVLDTPLLPRSGRELKSTEECRTDRK